MSLNFNGNYIGGVPLGESGGGTSNHAQLTNLDYANSGHTGFLSSDMFIQDGTIYTIEADGSGDFATIYDAIDFLANKISNGVVTFQFGNGTFSLDSAISIGVSNFFNIPLLKIQGKGAGNTILNITMADGTQTINVRNTDIEFANFTYQCTSGDKTTNYKGIRADSGGRVRVSSCTFNGINKAVSTFGSGILTLAKLNISNCKTAVNADGGTVLCSYQTTININNVTTGFDVSTGGQIHLSSPSITYTSVTNKTSQTVGSAVDKGWITGVTV